MSDSADRKTGQYMVQLLTQSSIDYATRLKE